jgi:maltose O-acetyltransferase
MHRILSVRQPMRLSGWLAGMTSAMTPDSADTRSMRERMEAGDLYIARDPELVAGRQRGQQLCRRFNDAEQESPAQLEILRELLGSLGEQSRVLAPFHCDYGTYIEIGHHTFVNYGCVILDVRRVVIGDHCLFGPNVQLLSATHPVDPDERRSEWEFGKPIMIGSDVWVGAGAIILPGITVGDAAVIAAGAVVTKDVAPRAIVGGNPARVLREI